MIAIRRIKKKTLKINTFTRDALKSKKKEEENPAIERIEKIDLN